MGLCTRKTTDPLLTELLRLRVNPLSIAREQSPLGTVYLIATSGGEISGQMEWQLDNVITEPFVVTPREVTTPPGQVLTQTMSSNLDIETSLNVVGRMLPSMGSDGKAKIKAVLKQAGAASCSVRLVEPSIQRLKVDELQLALLKASFTGGFAAALGGMTPYVCTGAWAAKALEVTVVDNDRRSLGLLAELDAVLKAEADVLVNLIEGRNSRKKFEAKRARLFFGVELMRLDQRPEGGLRLSPYRPEGALADDSEVLPTPPEEIWDEDATVLIQITPGQSQQAPDQHRP